MNLKNNGQVRLKFDFLSKVCIKNCQILSESAVVRGRASEHRSLEHTLAKFLMEKDKRTFNVE